jgi:hypothetical protein
MLHSYILIFFIILWNNQSLIESTLKYFGLTIESNNMCEAVQSAVSWIEIRNFNCFDNDQLGIVNFFILVLINLNFHVFSIIILSLKIQALDNNIYWQRSITFNIGVESNSRHHGTLKIYRISQLFLINHHPRMMD